MTEQRESTILPTEEIARPEITAAGPPTPALNEAPSSTPEMEVARAETVNAAECNGVGPECRHARAGRKGAHRVHQLIEEGRLYEQEHGLKRGRQRLRQLIDLGKMYEQEHGLRPASPKSRRRLSRLERQELVATFLQCLLRMVKPSFRDELTRLLEAMREKENGHIA